MTTDLALKKYDTDLAQQQTNIGMRSVLTPVNVNEAMELAKMFHASQMFQVQSVAQAFVILAMGMELGLSATQAFRSIHVIKGKPCLSADLMVALCKSSEICLKFQLLESDGDHALYETVRRGEDPVRMGFTIAQARQAGLIVDGSNWKKYPDAMCRARAAAALARAVYPDVCAGMYTDEEIDAIDITQRTAQVHQAAPTLPDKPAAVSTPEEQAERKRLGAYIKTLSPEDQAAVLSWMKSAFGGRVLKHLDMDEMKRLDVELHREDASAGAEEMSFGDTVRTAANVTPAGAIATVNDDPPFDDGPDDDDPDPFKD